MTPERFERASKAVEEAVRSLFTETDWVSIRVRPALDQDGEDMLWVDAVFRGSDAELVSDKGAAADLALWESVRRIGDPMLVVPLFSSEASDARA